VLTKADLIKPVALATLLQDVGAALKHKVGAHPEPIATSSKDSDGIAELRAALTEFALSA
jgi:GTP-binding protein EngB required for normal cell division